MSVDLRRVGVTFSFLIGIVCSSAYSQTVTRFDVIEASRSVNCEYVAAMVDSFVQGVPKKKSIIVLAYTGKNETKRDIGKRRLHNAKTYLVEYYKDTKFSRPS